MSRYLPGYQYAAEAAALQQHYSTALDQVAALNAQNQAQIDELTWRREQALSELVAALLPDVRPESLARAAQRTGYVKLHQCDPQAEMERWRAPLAARIAEIAADPRYRDRQLLRAPRIGTLIRAIAELEEFRAPLQELLDRALHLRLDHLLTSGYGTPAYNVPFWRLSYYQNRAAASEILARFQGKKEFVALREEILAARASLAVYDDKLAKLRQIVKESEDLEQELTDKTQNLETLPQRYLQSLREQIGGHLRDLDLVAIGDRLGSDAQVEMLAKRYMGLSKQISYLQECRRYYVDNNAAALQQSVLELQRDAVKYSRGKRLYDQVPIDRVDRYRTRYEKCNKQLASYQRTHRTVYLFDDYSHARLDDDFLWWDLMTSGTNEGLYLAEVAQFRESHPDYVYEPPVDRDRESRADAAAAAAGIAADDGGTSYRDIS